MRLGDFQMLGPLVIKDGKVMKTNSKVDRQIRAYINEINSLGQGKIVTITSCAGHRGHKLWNQPYVEITFDDLEKIEPTTKAILDRIFECKEITVKIATVLTSDKDFRRVGSAKPALVFTYSGERGLVVGRKILFGTIISSIKSGRKIKED